MDFVVKAKHDIFDDGISITGTSDEIKCDEIRFF